MQFPPKDNLDLRTVVTFTKASDTVNFQTTSQRESEQLLQIPNRDLTKESNEIIIIQSKLEKIEKLNHKQNIFLYCICASTMINSIIIFACLVMGILGLQWFSG